MLSVTQAQKMINHVSSFSSCSLFDPYARSHAFSAHLRTMIISITTPTLSDTWYSLKAHWGNFKTNWSDQPCLLVNQKALFFCEWEDPHLDKDSTFFKKKVHTKNKNQKTPVSYNPPPLVSQILNTITCAQLALIFLRSLDHMGGRFSLSQGCNVTSWAGWRLSHKA